MFSADAGPLGAEADAVPGPERRVTVVFSADAEPLGAEADAVPGPERQDPVTDQHHGSSTRHPDATAGRLPGQQHRHGRLVRLEEPAQVSAG